MNTSYSIQEVGKDTGGTHRDLAHKLQQEKILLVLNEAREMTVSSMESKYEK